MTFGTDGRSSEDPFHDGRSSSASDRKGGEPVRLTHTPHFTHSLLHPLPIDIDAADRRLGSNHLACSPLKHAILFCDSPSCWHLRFVNTNAARSIMDRLTAGRLALAVRSLRTIELTQKNSARSRITPLPSSRFMSHGFAPPDSIEGDWTSRIIEQIPARALHTPDAPLRVLILYGSLRKVSYSRLLAVEFARILNGLGADVKLFDPKDLPIKDESNAGHAKVTELRELSMWSEGMVWVSPEMHGGMTGVFKNQIDWIPLSLGSVRPTQGRTLALAQVNGGSQSFNCLNQLRILGRWMRCFVVPNQSSIPKAWTQFDEEGRLKDTGFRERVVDVAEEFWKMTYLLRPARESLDDRYSERKEKADKGRLQSQAEKEDAARKATLNGDESLTTTSTTTVQQAMKSGQELNEPEIGGDRLAQEPQMDKRAVIEDNLNKKD